MTSDEHVARSEILNLLATWTVLVDHGEVPAHVWTEDAVVLSPGGVRIQGRDNIVRRFKGQSYTYTTRDSDVERVSDQPAIPGSNVSASGGSRRTLHSLTTSLIRFEDADHATGITYYIAYSNDGPGSSGRYLDRYVRQDGRWLICERKTRIENLPPDPRWDAGRALIAADREAETRGDRW